MKAYDQVKADEMDGLIKTVDEIKLEQWRAKGQELINEARKVPMMCQQMLLIMLGVVHHLVVKCF